MSSPEYSLRRATVDDLAGLQQLWERAHLQVLDLERRLTEFQLIVTESGDLVGAIGLRIEGKQGNLHSEAFAQPEQEEQFRAQLWERIQIVARNHGLVRMWTQERSPFWQQTGFAEPPAELMKKLPVNFGGAQGYWLMLQLKEENLSALSVEHEFDLFQNAQKEETDKLMRLGQSLKTIVFAVLVIVLAAGFAYLVILLIRNPSILAPGPR